MRFAEKSFEIRFCAALSAAIMPFNRNPQWFGLTQAQERKAGIDAMLKMGGKLILFQFKAKDRYGKFHLDKNQWITLKNVSSNHKNSVFYVFPEAGTTLEAAKVSCIFKHSWLCSPSNLTASFNGNQKTTTLSLDPQAASLDKVRPKLSIAVQRACPTLGNFCLPLFKNLEIDEQRDSGSTLFYSQGYFEEGMLKSIESKDGIFIDKEFDDCDPFEKCGPNSTPGLFGLFLPSSYNVNIGDE